MHDVYFCPHQSAGRGSTWYTKASKSPISLWNPGKTLLGNPQPSICKTNGELLLIWVGWWFGMLRLRVPWKKQQSLKTWGDLRDPNHQTKPTLKPLAEFGSKKNGSNRIEFSNHPNKHGPCLFSPCGFTVHVPNNGFGNQSFQPT